MAFACAATRADASPHDADIASHQLRPRAAGGQRRARGWARRALKCVRGHSTRLRRLRRCPLLTSRCVSARA